MTTDLVVAPLLVPLVTAVLALVTRSWPRLQAAVSVAGVLAFAGAVAALALAVLPDAVFVYQVGNWSAAVGIVFVADALSAFMLVLAAVVAVPALLFSVVHVGEFGQSLSYHAFFHFMLAGVAGAFLTGDLFNLFVWFEVMLMASYALVAFYGGPEHTAAALRYIVLNLVGSAVMLLAIGGIYATTGTLNMAAVARRLASPEAAGVDPLPVLGLSALLFAVFALKAGVVPFQFWVPAVYGAAPAPVAAMLAGVTKKVGIYATIRLYFLVFAGADIAGTAPLSFYGVAFLVMATASVLLGGIGAVERDTVEGVLAYSSIGQVGFIVLPLAVGALVPAVRVPAVVAALVYALNHAAAKALLFLTAGAVDDATGTTRLGELGGLTRGAPWLSGAFFVGTLSLVGIPPLSGFFGKFLVFDAAVGAGLDTAVGALALAVALAGALLTIAYSSRVWNRGFWGSVTPLVDRARPAAPQVVVLALLAVVVVAIGVGFDPVYRFADRAADAATSPGPYLDAVLGGGVR
jgi:multicomponent Na+:H+ antiporter subunit D